MILVIIVGPQALVEMIEPDQYVSHSGDGIHPQIRARAMGGHALGLDIDPHKALVRAADAQPGRFGNDGGVGAPIAHN